MRKTNKKFNAAIIIIGNEILSGRTQDINVSFLSKWLNSLGVRVSEVRIIEDNEEIIIKTIKEVKNNFNRQDIFNSFYKYVEDKIVHN